MIAGRRLGVGSYAASVEGHDYEIDRFPEGSWLVFEVAKDGGREYEMDFATKALALAWIEERHATKPAGP